MVTRFGGNEFTAFSVPMVFGGRYFVLEPGTPPLLSVFREIEGVAVFEVLKNQPVSNPFSEATRSGAGVVTVTDRESGRFLYKVRPESETSVTFGRLDGGEISARIADTRIEVGGVSIGNSRFDGVMAGVVVRDDGGVVIGAPLPSAVLRLLAAR
jgi:hypothetical protein